MMDSVSFNARALFTFTPDRIYRVELRGGNLYFLRIGGQFDLDRAAPGAVGQLPALLILAAHEAAFRKHKEEFLARDPSQDPEELLGIHPHNFKLGPSDIRQATLLPKKWLLSFVRPHFGRLVIEQSDGKSQEFHFERLEDLQVAAEHLSAALGNKLTAKVCWNEQKRGFVPVA